jgi:hypothetical protein
VAGLDFRRCPHCGEEDFDLKSEERLYGYNRPVLTLDPAGRPTAAEWGSTSVDWESSTTTRYFCGSCGDDLPEEYQQALDRLLDNERDPEA